VVTQGLLLALSLVGGRVTVGAPGMKGVSAIASIVHRTDTRAKPHPLGWVVWDDALRPWVAVSRRSPAQLRDLVPHAQRLAVVDEDAVVYAPLVGSLPADYIIVTA
jgi:hypothetical protein